MFGVGYEHEWKLWEFLQVLFGVGTYHGDPKFLVSEFSIELPPGSVMGELGFLTPNNRRTATIECIEAGHVLTIEYDKLLEIYFQNPEFGYYFLILTSQRLLENNAKLEAIIAQTKIAPPIAITGVTG